MRVGFYKIWDHYPDIIWLLSGIIRELKFSIAIACCRFSLTGWEIFRILVNGIQHFQSVNHVLRCSCSLCFLPDLLYLSIINLVSIHHYLIAHSPLLPFFYRTSLTSPHLHLFNHYSLLFFQHPTFKNRLLFFSIIDKAYVAPKTSKSPKLIL